MDEQDYKFLQDFQDGRVEGYAVFNVFKEAGQRTPAVITTGDGAVAILLFAYLSEAELFAAKRALPDHQILRVDAKAMGRELATLRKKSEVPVAGLATVKRTE